MSLFDITNKIMKYIFFKDLNETDLIAECEDSIQFEDNNGVINIDNSYVIIYNN